MHNVTFLKVTAYNENYKQLLPNKTNNWYVVYLTHRMKLYIFNFYDARGPEYNQDRLKHVA